MSNSTNPFRNTVYYFIQLSKLYFKKFMLFIKIFTFNIPVSILCFDINYCFICLFFICILIARWNSHENNHPGLCPSAHESRAGPPDHYSVVGQIPQRWIHAHFICLFFICILIARWNSHENNHPGLCTTKVDSCSFHLFKFC